MEVISYNRASNEGMRMRRLFDIKYNESQLDVNGKTFEKYQVPAVMHSRVNKVKFLFESNLAGFKRPQIHVEADVEVAWGDFADHVTALNFKHNNQELPLTYVQPLEDDTLKVLIDAGLYEEERFELLMGKLMGGEIFDAEGDMDLSYMDVSEGEGSDRTAPVVLVNPVHIVHEKVDSSERTNLAELVRLAAANAIELQMDGVKTGDMVRSVPEETKQIIINVPIQDAVAAHNEQQIINEVDGSFKISSPLLDKEIDITEQIKGSLGLNLLSEDDRIRDLKERDRLQRLQEQQQSEEDSRQTVSVVNTIEAEEPLDPNIFEGGIGSTRRSVNLNDNRIPDEGGPDL